MGFNLLGAINQVSQAGSKIVNVIDTLDPNINSVRDRLGGVINGAQAGVTSQVIQVPGMANNLERLLNEITQGTQLRSLGGLRIFSGGLTGLRGKASQGLTQFGDVGLSNIGSMQRLLRHLTPFFGASSGGVAMLDTNLGLQKGGQELLGKLSGIWQTNVRAASMNQLINMLR